MVSMHRSCLYNVYKLGMLHELCNVHKLGMLHELCNVYKLGMLHELCNVYKLGMLHELCNVYKLGMLHEFAINQASVSHGPTWTQQTNTWGLSFTGGYDRIRPILQNFGRLT